ncbi:hypothetical protein ACFFNY_23725 [Paenibacillus hodogayensis]|uniref:Uncharacterized protein n=1 Tax=Paenibacillus hodogayensis TaxID=279208 RepID=A0ABV5W1Z8_9BACL
MELKPELAARQIPFSISLGHFQEVISFNLYSPERVCLLSISSLPRLCSTVRVAPKIRIIRISSALFAWLAGAALRGSPRVAKSRLFHLPDSTCKEPVLNNP